MPHKALIARLSEPACAELREPQRLAVMLALAAPGLKAFAELGVLLRLTDGNLASHLRRLAAAGWIQSRRGPGRGRASRTEYTLTAAGRDALAQASEIFAGAAQAMRLAADGASGESTAVEGTAGRAEVGSMEHREEPQTGPPSLLEERFSGPD